MPAKSKAQQQAAGVALAAKRGDKDPSELEGAAKEMYDSMSEKELEEFAKTKHDDLPEKKEEKSVVEDADILTERQKKELKKVIDTLVEERVKERQSEFVKKYSRFIVESATSKIVDRMRRGMIQKVQEEIDNVKTKCQRVCESVLLEASSKVQSVKKSHKKLLEEFKASAPNLIKESAEKKAKQLAEEAVGAIEENDRLTKIIQVLEETLRKSGYVINEDIDKVIEKTENEKKMLRTKLIETRRENKLNQLTEGMLPTQKKKIIEMLEDCVTEKQVEDRFLSVKAQVFEEERTIEPKDKKQDKVLEKTRRILEEEQNFNKFLGASREFIEKNV